MPLCVPPSHARRCAHAVRAPAQVPAHGGVGPAAVYTADAAVAARERAALPRPRARLRDSAGPRGIPSSTAGIRTLEGASVCLTFPCIESCDLSCFMHTPTRARTHARKHARTHTHTSTHTHTHARAHTHAPTRTHAHTLTRARTRTCTCVIILSGGIAVGVHCTRWTYTECIALHANAACCRSGT